MKFPVLDGEARKEALRTLEANGYKVKPRDNHKHPSKNISFFGNRTERMVIR
ncbi:hypothetical protein [Paenibacillus albiflavus]|uniref:hypothetical protein n=1 Tax=Paenibacillus albiflavus TaxID=2545760 RepID=UPI00140465D6|nr:hypothetical protein [Paenibacillus albiflavus]